MEVIGHAIKLIGLLVLAAVPHNLRTEPAGRHRLRADQSVAKADRVRVAMFTASWCGPCQAWKRSELPKLKAAGWSVGGDRTHSLQVIDYDTNKGEFNRLDLKYLPAFVVIRDERVVTTLQGVQTAATIQDRVRKATNE